MKICRLTAMASAVLFAGAAAMPAAANTLEVVSGPTGQRAVTLPFTGTLGQSFTAFDSDLSSVGFQFEKFNPGNPNTPFTLSLLAGSTLAGPALYSTTFTVNSNSTAATWTDVDITGWTVATGQTYTFTLSNSSYLYGIVLGPEINIYTGQVLGSDAYAGGTALFTNVPYYYYPNGVPTPFCETTGMCDLNFRITATSPAAPAVPEPASWALMIGGFALAGAGLRRSRARAIAFA